MIEGSAHLSAAYQDGVLWPTRAQLRASRHPEDEIIETWYISGPMTKIPQFNFPRFDAVRDCLLGLGIAVVSPADHDRAHLAELQGLFVTPEMMPGYPEGDLQQYLDATGFGMDALLGWDIQMIVGKCDAIVMLPGWENSTGARWERMAAEATKKKVIIAEPLYSDDFGWGFTPDEVQDRLTRELANKLNPEPVSRVEVTPCGCTHPGCAHAERAPHDGSDWEKVTGETGGQKGVKDIEISRIPPEVLEALGRHFYYGSRKYPDVAPGVANWSLGYPWSAGINALDRHWAAFKRGEDFDTDPLMPDDTRHLAGVLFHASTLLWFSLHGAGTDDRYTVEKRDAYVSALEAREKYAPKSGETP